MPKLGRLWARGQRVLQKTLPVGSIPRSEAGPQGFGVSWVAKSQLLEQRISLPHQPRKTREAAKLLRPGLMLFEARRKFDSLVRVIRLSESG